MFSTNFPKSFAGSDSFGRVSGFYSSANSMTTWCSMHFGIIPQDRAHLNHFVTVSTSWGAIRLLTANQPRFSASDLSDGRVVRMLVQIQTTNTVLISLSKTLYHNCFSPPRSKIGTCEGRVGGCLALCTKIAAIVLYTPQGAKIVSGMIYEPEEQG